MAASICKFLNWLINNGPTYWCDHGRNPFTDCENCPYREENELTENISVSTIDTNEEEEEDE